jgi:hypothetical protein
MQSVGAFSRVFDKTDKPVFAGIEENVPRPAPEFAVHCGLIGMSWKNDEFAIPVGRLLPKVLNRSIVDGWDADIAEFSTRAVATRVFLSEK